MASAGAGMDAASGVPGAPAKAAPRRIAIYDPHARECTRADAGVTALADLTHQRPRLRMGAHPSLEVRADTALTDEAHDLGVTFTLTATDVSYGLSAQATFTDAAPNPCAGQPVNAPCSDDATRGRRAASAPNALVSTPQARPSCGRTRRQHLHQHGLPADGFASSDTVRRAPASMRCGREPRPRRPELPGRRRGLQIPQRACETRQRVRRVEQHLSDRR